MAASNIEWTECTWNFQTGCDKISTGCRNCYAEIFARRLKAMGNTKYAKGFTLTIHEHVLEFPLKWKKPRLVFVNSMSDSFHSSVPLRTIEKAFHTMGRAHWHQFQILTKRSERLAKVGQKLPWHPNIWMGVTVETADFIRRIEDLKQTHAKIKFLSLEPLLSPLPGLNLEGIDWVIVGGESGPRARPMKMEWVKEIRDRCVSARVPFFFKQWGGVNKKAAGRSLEGRQWNQMPHNVINKHTQPTFPF
jgi:protein gp37